MKNRRYLILEILVLILLTLSLAAMIGCGSKNTTTSAPTKTAAPVTASAPAAQAAAPTSSVPAASAAPITTTTSAPVAATAAAEKTIKIGEVAWSGWPNGLDMVHGIQVMADMDNANGGIEIGGEKYKVEIVQYDSNNSQATEVAAVNRLVFEDKVNYVFCDGMNIGAWLAVTDANKVMEFGGSMDFRFNMDPKWSYSYAGMFGNPQQPIITGWIAAHYPNLTKNMVVAYPDNQWGHSAQEQTAGMWKIFGVQPADMFYPSSASDLSSLGTKVVSLNPASFSAVGGGPITDALALKAVYQAGYRGQLFANSTAPALTLANLLPAEALEGFINAAWPVEFDPPLSQIGIDFKKAWIAKYGKWEGPEVQAVGYYSCLKTAMQKAGSTDVDKVKAVLDNGMEYEAPTGMGKMISRPDLGNNRTVDSICAYCMKEIKSGKPTLLSTISIDEGTTYFHQAYPVPTAAP